MAALAWPCVRSFGAPWTGNSPDVAASWHDMAEKLLDVGLHLELGPPEGVAAHDRSRTERPTVCLGSLHDLILEWCMAPNDGITRSAFNPTERAIASRTTFPADDASGNNAESRVPFSVIASSGARCAEMVPQLT